MCERLCREYEKLKLITKIKLNKINGKDETGY